MEYDDDALTTALSSRHISHNRGSKNSRRAAFDPRRAVGVYHLSCKGVKTVDGQSGTEDGQSSFTIYGFTPGETGLLASFRIGGLGFVMEGMGVLAGTREGVRGIVGVLDGENADDDDISGENEEEEENGGEGSENANTNNESDDEEEEEDKPKSTLESHDATLNQRFHAFEKNSFRVPKFWLRWRGRVVVPGCAASGDAFSGNSFSKAGEEEEEEGEKEEEEQEEEGEEKEVNEEGDGYLVFKGNGCEGFEGTWSSRVLGWDNVKVKGRRVRGRAGECGWRWGDFGEGIGRE